MKVKLILVIAMSVVVIAGCNKNEKDEINFNLNDNSPIKEGVVGDNAPVTRAFAAKMLALSVYSRAEIESMDRNIEFSDTNIEEWYDKYINAVYNAEIMNGIGHVNLFEPESFLTLQQAQYIIDNIDSTNKIKIKITDETKGKPISMALWNELYEKMLESTENAKIENINLVVLADSKVSGGIKENYAITDAGVFCFDGIDTDKYLNSQINVMRVDKNIVNVKEVISLEPTVESVYILGSDELSVDVFVGGVEKKFSHELEEEYIAGLEGTVANIKIDGDKLLSIEPCKNKITGCVKLVSNNTIELDNLSPFKVDKNFKLYSIEEGRVKSKEIKDIIVGSNESEFFLKDNIIIGGIFNNVENGNVRVLLNNGNSRVRDNIFLTSNEKFYIKYGTEIKNYNENEVVEFSENLNSDLFGENRIYINSENKRFVLKNTKEDEGVAISGTLEVSKRDNKFILINEREIEECLVNKFNAEDINEEMHKALAVINRSIIYSEKYKNKLNEYGANMESSMLSNVEANDATKKAIEDTKHIVIKYNNKIVSPNYFAVSCGVTANSGEVWAGTGTNAYPSETLNYLKGKILLNKKVSNLDENDEFLKFIKDSEIDSLEKDDSWFRWNFKMSAQELSNAVNNNLRELSSENSPFVRVLTESGFFKKEKVESVGTVKNIEVTQRGKNGNVMEVKIIGTEKIVLIETDNVIKKVFAPKQFTENENPIILKKFDLSEVENMPALPSSFFAFEKTTDENENISEIIFYGGGNGHGVGMSLEYAKNMAEDWRGILEYFYEGITMENMI